MVGLSYIDIILIYLEVGGVIVDWRRYFGLGGYVRWFGAVNFYFVSVWIYLYLNCEGGFILGYNCFRLDYYEIIGVFIFSL